MRIVDSIRRARSRGQTYALLIGTVTGMLIAGLLVPFVFGTPIQQNASTSRPQASRGSSGEETDLAGGSVDEAPAGGDATRGTGPDVGDQGTASGNGPSSEEAPSPGAPTTGTDEASDEPLGATDTGVTGEAVKLGILIADIGGLADAGFGVAVGDQERQWEVFLEKINERSGIDGRDVEFAIERFDPLDQDDMRRACVALTEDEKVFAAMNTGGYFGAAILCITEEHRTPFIGGDGEPYVWYDRSGGLYFSVSTAKTRALQNQVDQLDKLGLLPGKTIGILDAAFENDKMAVDNGLVPTLQNYGYDIAHRATLSNDAAEASSQIPIEVNQMRANEVDAVFLATNFVYATQFVQEADSQQYFPQYFTTDFASGTTDFYAERMPDSFEGSIGITATRVGAERVDEPEPEIDASCRKTYEETTGQDLERGTTEYGATILTCGLARNFEVAAERAGADLTRPRLSAGYRSFGSFAFPGISRGSYGPDKFDAADFVRTIEWRADCECWIPIDDFRAPRF